MQLLGNCKGGKKSMSKEFDRDQVIFTITLMTNYAEGYLQGLSDERLLKVYHRVMNGE